MDGGNRRILVASSLLAFPAVLLMASLSSGTPPTAEIALAVGQAGDDTGAVQQVVGKQLRAPKPRPIGLLRALSGERHSDQPTASHDHQHRPQKQGSRRGLLDSLFNGASGPTASKNSKSTQHAKHSGHSANQGHSNHRAANNGSANRGSTSGGSENKGAVNWDGIPYHHANASARSTTKAPIRDYSSSGGALETKGQGGSSVAAHAGTRIIRGKSARTIPAKSVSLRRAPALPAKSTPTLAAPRPSTEQKVDRYRSEAISQRSSSRRDGRRGVGTLDASEIAAASKSSSASNASGHSDSLVPKVSRRKIVEKKSKLTAVEETPAAKSASETKTAKVDTKPVDTPPSLKVDHDQALPQPSTQPSDDLVAKKVKSEPAPASHAADSAPAKATSRPSTAAQSVATKPELAKPEVTEPRATQPEVTGPAKTGSAKVVTTTAQPSPAPAAGRSYTTPASPGGASIPTVTVPRKSKSGSTPSFVVGHRSGPPNSAFAPATIAGSGAEARVQESFAKPARTSLGPIGSGVVPSGDVASYVRPHLEAVQPEVPATDQAAENAAPRGDSYQHADPYAARHGIGKPYPPTARVATRPSGDAATIPMHPIDPNRSPTSKDIATSKGDATSTRSIDNFAASNVDARNQRIPSDRSRIARGKNLDAAVSELPGIRVTTAGPSEIMIRQINQYEVAVENRGSMDAEGVLVRVVVPHWAELRGQNATQGDIDPQTLGSTERLVWTIDHLPAGSVERMFVRLKAARSGTYNLDVDWTLVPQRSVAKVHVYEPKLDLSIDGPDEVVYGQSQTYKVRVLNPGDGTAHNVVFTLSPNSATPQTQRIGDIPPGKEAQFDVELTAQDLGDLKIHGLASGDLELRAESAKTIRVAAAKLEAMLSGPGLKFQNTESMYSLQVQNKGMATSERIVATLRLPVGVNYVGGIDEAELRGHTLRWEINALAPGATRNYQFRCNMAATGEHLFVFNCTGSAAGHTDVTISTRVDSIADLVLSVSDPAAPAPIGTDVSYEIVVRNRGSKEARDVHVVAQFSHGIEPQRIDGHSGEVVTGQVVFDVIPRIGPGQEVRLQVIAQAQKAGHHRFRTEVRSGDDNAEGGDSVLVAEEATRYMSPTGDRVSRRSGDGQNR